MPRLPDPTDPRPLRQKRGWRASRCSRSCSPACISRMRVVAPPSWPSYTSSASARAAGGSDGQGGPGDFGFFGAVQILVIGGALTPAAVFHTVSPAAPVAMRLWLVTAASMGCGLLGLRIAASNPESVVFPAYRAASLCFVRWGLCRTRGGPSLVWLGCGSPRPGVSCCGPQSGLPACMWPMACRSLDRSLALRPAVS